jgi:hypothetical protein
MYQLDNLDKACIYSTYIAVVAARRPGIKTTEPRTRTLNAVFLTCSCIYQLIQ